MFEQQPTARADLKAGTLYAVAGERRWVYYGQVTPEKNIGFFRRRDHDPIEVDAVPSEAIMSVVTVSYPSITRALRTGRWKKLGRFPVAGELLNPRPSVQWPAGTLTVSIGLGNEPERVTSVDDPSIQDMERMAVWDAEHHIPSRLTADFGKEEAKWHVGGPIRRERRIKEILAERFPDQPWHKLPSGWVPTSTR